MNWILSLSLLVFVSCAHKGFDARLSQFKYPFEVREFTFKHLGEELTMAYMDLNPTTSPQGTVVLLHGKNFGGFYFERIAQDLLEKNYRVIIPDQIGFGKSSKPDDLQYTFHFLSQNTFNLLNHLKVQNFVLVGHSMGGMLATRMALMEPKKIKKMILINPIGLEDYKTLTPYRSVDELYKMELQNTPEKIKQYQNESYYAGHWKPEYDSLIVPATDWTKNPDFPLTAKIAALTTEMVYTQPVYYEFSLIKVPTVLINGLRDRTAVGKGWASEENKKKMGNYPELGKKTIKIIPQARLIELPGLGHVPFIENYEQFMKEFDRALRL